MRELFYTSMENKEFKHFSEEPDGYQTVYT